MVPSVVPSIATARNFSRCPSAPSTSASNAPHLVGCTPHVARSLGVPVASSPDLSLSRTISTTSRASSSVPAVTIASVTPTSRASKHERAIVVVRALSPIHARKHLDPSNSTPMSTNSIARATVRDVEETLRAFSRAFASNRNLARVTRATTRDDMTMGTVW